MQSLDYVVVGGGVVGLAIAASLRPFGSVAVLEQHSLLIHETSSRNSCVLHAGIYYPAASLKTRLCMEGNANLWRWQQRFPAQITASRVGKWIGTCAADPSEEAALAQLISNMKERGVAYEMVSSSQQRALEPAVRMKTVVNSLNTGIVDVSSLRDAFVEVIESTAIATLPNAGDAGVVSPCAEVVRIDVNADALQGAASAASPAAAPSTTGSITVTVRAREMGGQSKATQDAPKEGPDPFINDPNCFSLQVNKAVVCAAGLHGNELWRRLFVNRQWHVQQPPSHRLYFCKGRYTRYTGRSPPVSRLVYPCPLPQLVGLGVHSTVDMADAVRFGPDAVYTNRLNDYGFSDESSVSTHAAGGGPTAVEAFVDSQWEAVRRYIPSIERARMAPDYVGIRAKLAGPGEPFRDFLFEELVSVSQTDGADHPGALTPTLRALTGCAADSAHAGTGRARLVFATGIESPGLTASTAIGEFITKSLLPDSSIFDSFPPPWSPSASERC